MIVNGVERPLVVQATSGTPVEYDASDFRALFYALARDEGVGTTSDFTVSPGSLMSVNVSAGIAVVNADTSALSKYIIRSATNLNVPGIPVTPSGTRVHRLVAEVVDTHPNYLWRLRLMMDTGSGTPAEPTATATTLALIELPGSASSITAANINRRRKLSSVAPKPIFRGERTDPIVNQPHNSDKDLIGGAVIGNTDFPQGDVVYARRIEYPGVYRLRAEAEYSRFASGADYVIPIQVKIQTCNPAGGTRVTIGRRGIDSSHNTTGLSRGIDDTPEYRLVTAEVIHRFDGGEYVTATTQYDEIDDLLNLNGGCLEIEYLRS